MSGEKLFESVPLPGVQAGTPVATEDGRYVLINSNVDKLQGYFSLLDTNGAVPDVAVAVTYTSNNASHPFSPIGYFHKPAEGYFENGLGNPNDVFIFASDLGKDSITAGTGQVYGFQLSNIGSPLALLLLGGDRDFKASTAPVLSRFGRAMYWSVTRSQTQAWVANISGPAARFDRGRSATQEFTRGSPVYIGARATPTLSSDPNEPYVYGPSASQELFRLSYDFSERVMVQTSAIMSSRVVVSPQDDYIYYVLQNGNLTQARASTLETVWSISLNAPVESDMALSLDGTTLFVADTAGLVRAFQVATGGTAPNGTVSPTSAPLLTASPSGSLASPTTSLAPSMAPVSGNPVSLSSEVPSAIPTFSSKPIPASPSSSQTTLRPIRRPTRAPSGVTGTLPISTSSAFGKNHGIWFMTTTMVVVSVIVALAW